MNYTTNGRRTQMALLEDAIAIGNVRRNQAQQTLNQHRNEHREIPQSFAKAGMEWGKKQSEFVIWETKTVECYCKYCVPCTDVSYM